MKLLNSFRLGLNLKDRRGGPLHVSHSSKLSTSYIGDVNKQKKRLKREVIAVLGLRLNPGAASPRKTLQFLVRIVITPYNEKFTLWHDIVNDSISP